MTSYDAEIKRTLEQPLAYGRTAEIYPWEAGSILKLFHEWVSLNDIHYELNISRAVHASGLPVPAVGDLVNVNGRHGLIYESVEGESMLDSFRRQPWHLFNYARRLAVLHAQMHETKIDIELPSQRQRLQRKIERAAQLPDATRSRLLQRLENLPDGRQICHGDFHFDNVLLSAHGEVIIDWTDATLGNPLADVARTTILALGAAASDQITNLLAKGMVRLFHRVYLRHYFHLRPEGQEEYQRWLPIVAAARLEENIPDVEAWLAAQAEK